MEQPNNIDQFFRERLQSAEVPPPAFVWPNVERELRQRRRRFFFWLWFGLGLTGAGAWALWPTARSVTSSVATTPKTEETRATGVGSLATRDEDYTREVPGTGMNSSPASKETKAAKTSRDVKAIFRKFSLGVPEGHYAGFALA